MSIPIASLDTPAALVDIPQMQRNIQRMQQRMSSLGVRLRPHIKTSKCLPVIHAQIAAGASGVTVSTLKEAEHCFAAGISDVFYAVAIAPNKLPQVLALRRKTASRVPRPSSLSVSSMTNASTYGSKSIATAIAPAWPRMTLY